LLESRNLEHRKGVREGQVGFVPDFHSSGPGGNLYLKNNHLKFALKIVMNCKALYENLIQGKMSNP